MTSQENPQPAEGEPPQRDIVRQEPKSTDEQTQTAPSPEFLNPVISEREVGRLELLYRRLSVSPRIARVLATSSGRCTEYRPDKQPTFGELIWGGVRTIYDVDLSTHTTQIDASPPSRGDTIAFLATVDLQWHVADPSMFVHTGIDNIKQAVAPALLSHLRAVTRQHDVDQLESAELAANKALTNEALGKDALGAEFGLSVQAYVRLTMDESSLRHAAIQREVDLFRSIIASGDYDQFALQLALKPGTIDTVVKLLVDERDNHRKAVFDFVTRLLESDALDRWQIDDQVRTTLQWLRDSGYKVLTGTDETRRASFGENHRMQPGESSPP